MSDQLNVLCARVPGEWFVGEKFDNGGYRWEITVVSSVEQGYTTFTAQRLYPLDDADSLA